MTLWLNGGPGCSSLNGMFSEVGPLVFSKEDSSNFEFNSYRWNRVSNVLFLESPSIVGKF